MKNQKQLYYTPSVFKNTIKTIIKNLSKLKVSNNLDASNLDEMVIFRKVADSSVMVLVVVLINRINSLQVDKMTKSCLLHFSQLIIMRGARIIDPSQWSIRKAMRTGIVELLSTEKVARVEFTNMVNNEAAAKGNELQRNSEALKLLRKLLVANKTDRLIVGDIVSKQLTDEGQWLMAYWKVRDNEGSFTRAWEGNFIADQSIADLLELKEEVTAGIWKPRLARRIWIEKPNKPGEYRPLTIATARDKVVQMVVKIILENAFDVSQGTKVFGFRPRLGTLDALSELVQNKEWGRIKYVVEMDIKSCFDKIPHAGLMDEINKVVDNVIFKDIIIKCLEAPFAEDQTSPGTKAKLAKDGIAVAKGAKIGETIKPTEGTPQGSVVSPMLSNIFLKKFDDWCENNNIRYNRYADDSILGKTGLEEQDTQKLLAEIREFSHSIGQPISDQKTVVTNWMEKSIKYLGYEINNIEGEIELNIIKNQNYRDLLVELEEAESWEAITGELRDKVVSLLSYAKLGKNRRVHGLELVTAYEVNLSRILKGLGFKIELVEIQELQEKVGINTSDLIRPRRVLDRVDKVDQTETSNSESEDISVNEGINKTFLRIEGDNLLPLSAQELEYLIKEILSAPSGEEALTLGPWIHDLNYLEKDRIGAINKLRVFEFNQSNLYIVPTCIICKKGDGSVKYYSSRKMNTPQSVTDVVMWVRGMKFAAICDKCLLMDVQQLLDKWNLGKATYQSIPLRPKI